VVIYDHDRCRGNESPRSIHVKPFGLTATASDVTARALAVDTKRDWSYASKGASIEHWLKCIAGEETPTTDGEVGRAGIEIAEAAYRSAQTGQVVQLRS
jgi:predicted dehydrogenase